jgi:hypothetical protein
MIKHKHYVILNSCAKILKVDFSEVDNHPLTLKSDDDK